MSHRLFGPLSASMQGRLDFRGERSIGRTGKLIAPRRIRAGTFPDEFMLRP
jgi:hypothetical protein